MSGICGIVHWNDAPATAEEVRPMLDAAQHRGPDGVFCRAERNAAFGYLSLEITPESEGEVQPIVHTPTGVMVAADLRLDNRDDLIQRLGKESVERHRREISARGRTAGESLPTDAELVLIAYLRWESECFTHLLGDFAVAIRDPRRNVCRLARDPMGLKPLYYQNRNGCLAFASETAQILSTPKAVRRINDVAIAAHLLNRQHDLLRLSFYDGIEQVPPGQEVICTAAESKLRQVSDLTNVVKLKLKTEADYVHRFRELFLESVRTRMRSIKPIGISLSGGMDSMSIAASVGWLRQHNALPPIPEFQTYSYRFDDQDLISCDERHVSRLISEKYDFPTFEIPGDDGWTLADYPNHGPHDTEPFMGPFQCMIERTVSQMSRNQVGLQISGGHGDPLLGSDLTDLPELLMSGNWNALIGEFRFLRRAMGYPSILRKHFAKPVVQAFSANIVAQFLLASFFRKQAAPENRIPSYLNSRFLESCIDRLPSKQACRPKDRKSSADTRSTYLLLPNLLRAISWMERMNSRSKITYTDPFTDQRLIRLILSTPQSYVNQLHRPKRILRSAMSEVITEKILKEIKKVSLDPLFRKGVKEKSSHLLLHLIKNSQAAERGYVNTKELENIISDYINGRCERFRIWSFVTLETWLRRYWS